jgi:NTE family protein
MDMNAPDNNLILPKDRQVLFSESSTFTAAAPPERPRIGLALSSGGAKGLAHIGVIQVLEENGIPIDAVAGCSMGAYIGAIWAHGETGRQMEVLARELESRAKLCSLLDPALPPRRGFIHGKAIIRHLRRTLGEAHFADLARQLRVVATNLDTLETRVFDSGPVTSAVHASCAIPGVCVPVAIDGETYIDGGVTNPLPVDVLKQMGMDRVIAVNTIPTPAYLICCREWNRERAGAGRRKSNFITALNTHLNYFARGNVLDTMMRAVHGAQIRVAEGACRNADLVLRPLACDARWHDFTHPGKYIALGRRIAEENLDAIRALVAQPATHHETACPQNVVPAHA